MSIEEIIEREMANVSVWTLHPGGQFVRPASARKMARAVAESVAGHFQSLFHAAEDVAHCPVDSFSPCGVCFGCHLLAGLDNARPLLPQEKKDSQ